MSGAGTGYDLSPTTYNPEGKVFQIEYAMKATENGETIVGLKCKDGIVIGGERHVVSRMMIEGTNKLVHGVTKTIGAILTGVIPDGKAVLTRAKLEAAHYQEFYGKPIGVRVLAERIALYMHAHTLYGVFRPFGTNIIFSGMDGAEYKLFMVEPSGAFYEYYACAGGKGSQVCKSEIDKFEVGELSCEDGLYRIMRMLLKSREEGQEKRIDIEAGWISESTGSLFTPIGLEMRKDVEGAAKAQLDREEQGED